MLDTTPLRNSHLGRGAQQRIQRQLKLHAAANDTISALNSCAGYLTGCLRSASAAQRSAQAHILHCVETVGPPPPGITREAAFSALLSAASSYTGNARAATLGNYVNGLVALPSIGSTATPLGSLLSGKARESLLNPLEHMLLDTAAYGMLLDKQERPEAYWDPKLRHSAKAYRDFIVEPHNRGMIAFTDKPYDSVGIFFVKKKDGRLRLVVDARRPNMRFRAPPTSGLASAEAFAHLDTAGENREFFVAQSDIKDYF